MFRKMLNILLFGLFSCAGLLLWAQDNPPQDPKKDDETRADAVPENQATPDPAEEGPITGGVPYQPNPGRDNKVRDPFKSPFELEQEEREKRKGAQAAASALDDKLPYSLNELELRGIYYQAESGYRAIFLVGNEYKWWSSGVKFQDADLVNITDEAVVFKQYAANDETQVREVVRELHRGEE